MPRTFTAASSEKVDLALGAGASISGASTLAAIIKPASDGAVKIALCVGSGTNSKIILGLNAGNAVTSQHSGTGRSGTTTVTAADGWALIMVTKATGTATPRFHIYEYGTGAAMVHENGGGTAASAAPQTSSAIGYNRQTNANFWDGQIAVAGAWAAAFTDAQCETLPYNLEPWFQVQPNGLWILDQASTAMLVNDRTGNGANQTAITGTTVSANAVPVWSYGVPPRPALSLQPPGNIVTGGELRLISTVSG